MTKKVLVKRKKKKFNQFRHAITNGPDQIDNDSFRLFKEISKVVNYRKSNLGF